MKIPLKLIELCNNWGNVDNPTMVEVAKAKEIKNNKELWGLIEEIKGNLKGLTKLEVSTMAPFSLLKETELKSLQFWLNWCEDWTKGYN